MFDYVDTPTFDADLRRLKRFRREYAESVFDLIENHLTVYGGVPESCEPHALVNPRGCFSGYMECHVEPDVLLVYRVTRKHVLLARICTHGELESCRFGREWPAG